MGISSEPPPERPGGAWTVEHLHGAADELHHLEVPPRRTLMVMHVDAPALVLGSTQPAQDVDPAAAESAGVSVVRRRSGGGAVLLVPGAHVWVDLVVPAGDPLWSDDVEAATWWVGAAWSSALRVGAPTEVHRRGVSDRDLGRVVCFAATGPGEVVVGGRKLVGVSQRRTRHLARFQCIVHRRFDPGGTLGLVASSRRTPELVRSVHDDVTDLDALGVDPRWSVVEELLTHLP